MITEAMLRSRKRGFELEVERYIQESVSARTPKLEEINAKKAEVEAAIERIKKALNDFDADKKSGHPPLLAGTDPMVLVPPTKRKGKRGKGRKGTAIRDKIAFALEK